MHVDLLRRAVLTRRAFLGGAAATGVAAVAGRAGDAEDMAAAERLLGLSFTAEERAQAGERLAEQRADYSRLRAVSLDLGVPPALRFDPRPPGTSWPAPGEGAAGARFAPLADLPRLSTDDDLAFASVHELASLLRAGKTTSAQLTALALARLKAHDPVLRCVVTLLEEQARAAAARADAEIAEGKWRGPLHGIPFGAKDLLAWPGAPTTFGAEPFREQVLEVEATALAKLRDAGAVLVAKLSLGALAMGDVWFGGRTRNPWNPEQGSSGSSAGSAAAVAAGLVPFALGSETYGSIVSPCSRCGATGLRPTFGTVSRFGAMPLSWSMDKLGPIARTAADCALVFDAIRGPDGRDPDAVAAPFAWQRGADVRGLRIGHLEGNGGGDRGRAATGAVLECLERAGAAVRAVRLPDLPARSLLLILFAEAATVFDDLAREGGLRALGAQGPGDWPNLLRSARFVSAVEYLRALRVRTALIERTHEALADVDVVVAPPSGNALAVTNLTGHPCCVLPAGARDDGTPRAATVLGRLWREADVLAVAEHWQRQTDWHRRRPG